MSVVKYVVGILGFLLIFAAVSAIITGVLVLIVPPSPGAGSILGDWRLFPGPLFGFLFGLHSFHASVKEPKKKGSKAEKPNEEA